jgi:hypothetical protein
MFAVTIMVTREAFLMKSSSRFTVAVHILSVIALSGIVLCTSEYISGIVKKY